MKIIFVTGSQNKFDEAKQVIPGLEHKDLDLLEIQGVDPKPIIAHKLEEAKKVLQGNLVVEDNSLYIDSLKGLPGPLIKWFMKTIGNDGLVKISESYGNPRATAKCIVGFSKEDGTVEYFEGSIDGEIVRPRGENGFGWDPIFQPEGSSKTFAEMTQEEKNKISMRKIAFQKLKNYLE
jgi:non-canonical purine NTP pyrophosphatase (RdgB/HAM1 family)